jgi:glutamine synthetase
MRDGAKGMPYIDDMMKKLGAKHALHISVYGDDNAKRLTGHHETSSCDVFSYGVANRAASFRIPTQTAHANGKGYIEDRRPASNINPYIVGALLADTTLLEESLAAPMLEHFTKWQLWKTSVNMEKSDWFVGNFS